LTIILCLFKTHIIDKILNGILSILGNYHPPKVHNSTLGIFFHFWRKVVFQLLTHGRVYVRMVSVLCLPYFWQTNIAMGKAPFFGGKSFVNGNFKNYVKLPEGISVAYGGTMVVYNYNPGCNDCP